MNQLLSIATVLLLLSSNAFASKVVTDLESYTFEQYVQDFNVKYYDKEYDVRKFIFENELKRVRDHNAKDLPWKESINKFSVFTEEEKKRKTHGRVKMNKKNLNLSSQQGLPKDFVVRPVADLPKHVDWREKGIISTVKDQGHCGSCWAFASTATMESHIAKETGLLYELSVQQVAMCAPNTNHCGGVGGCEGSTAELAFDYTSTSGGLYQEYQYGYYSYYGKDMTCTNPPGSGAKPVATISSFVKLPDNNYETLMNAIATVGPVAINVDASTWHAYHGGIFEGCNMSDPDVNHVVVLVGYGEENGKKYWLVRNSWSAGWGERGFIRLSRYDNDNERCGMDTHPQDGVECEGSTEPVKVCGTCGAIYDSSYPTGAKRV